MASLGSHLCIFILVLQAIAYGIRDLPNTKMFVSPIGTSYNSEALLTLLLFILLVYLNVCNSYIKHVIVKGQGHVQCQCNIQHTVTVVLT